MTRGDPFDLEYRLITKDGRTIWVHDHASLVEDQGGRPSWQGVLTDITERKRAEEALTRRDRILEASGFAAERFLNAPSWTDCIDDVLERAGEAASASRAYVFRNESRGDGERLTTQVFEWTAPGIDPTIGLDLTANIPYSGGGFERWERRLSEGSVIAGLVRELPESERDRLEPQGILSILVVPIFSAGEWWGFVGYDQCEEERNWQPAEIEALSLVANTLGAAIGRERAMRTLSETEARYQTLIEQIPAVTYMESAAEPGKKLYVSPQVRTILGLRGVRVEPRGLAAGDPSRRPRARPGRGSGHAGDRGAVQLRVPDGPSRRRRRLAPGRRRAAARRSWRAALLAGRAVRRHRAEGSRDPPPRGRARYRILVEQIPAITYIDERRGSDDPSSWPTTYISPQVETILGYSPEEWKCRSGSLGPVDPPRRPRTFEGRRSTPLRDRGAARDGAPHGRQGRDDPLDPGRGAHGDGRRRVATLEPGDPARRHRAEARPKNSSARPRTATAA